ncbi:MAG TPA: hypothetical protein VFI91_04735 [Longimicrobiaceae bacterium]|nr:hypothetical protein [Longimicrobiaceae bacterium]
MALTAFVTHSDCSRHDTGWRHPEHQGRLPALSRAVYRDMLALHEHLLEVEGRPADMEDLRLVHTARYIDEIRKTVDEAARVGQPVVFAGDAVLSGASWDALLAAVGCGLTAVDTVIEGKARNAFCAVRPPGRGADRDSEGRFGFFNTVAIAARHLRERLGAGPVLVVDLGGIDPTATPHILAADEGVKVLSIRQRSLTGARRTGSSGVEVVVRPGADGDEYRRALGIGLDAVLSGFSPDFVLLSAGFDGLRSDPLSDLSLEPVDYYDLTLDVRNRADRHCAGRLVSVLEGGYDPAGTGAAVVQHLRALAGLEPA